MRSLHTQLSPLPPRMDRNAFTGEHKIAWVLEDQTARSVDVDWLSRNRLYLPLSISLLSIDHVQHNWAQNVS